MIEFFKYFGGGTKKNVEMGQASVFSTPPGKHAGLGETDCHKNIMFHDILSSIAPDRSG